MTKVSGYVLHQHKDFITRNFGPQSWEKIVSSTPDSTRQVLSSPIMASEWYELRVYQDLNDGFEKVLGRDSRKRYLEYLAKDKFTGLFGLVARLMSAERIFGQAQSSWNKQFSCGKVQFVSQSDDLVIVRVLDFETNPAHKWALAYFFQELGKNILNKPVIGSYREIDPKNTEFSLKVKN